MLAAMEGTANTTTLEDDAQHLAYGNALAVRCASPSPSDGWGRPRSVSTISSLESSSTDKPASCVFREIAHTDCATQRFIIWAATRRNESSRMDKKDRLGCPLLRCNSHFPDHESMLRHLVNCDLLSSCEYWCYDHMRVEYFDDSRCQKGSGHTSSKRRKMFSVAKKFISSLGHHGTGKSATDSDTLDSPSCASISGQNPDHTPYASASLVSLFSLGGSSSVSRTFRKGNSNSSRRNSQSSNQSGSQNGGRRSIGHRFSAEAKRHSQSTRCSPPTRSSLVVCAELQSTEIVELDSKEVPAVSKNALLSPSSPRAYAFSSPTDQTGTASLGPVGNEATLLSPISPASHRPAVSPLSSVDFPMEPSTINPVQLVLSDNDSSTSIASLSSPASPLPFCPTPPVATGADIFAKPSTIDPMQLASFPDFGTASDFQQDLVEWDLSKNAAAITPSGMPGASIASMAPLYVPVSTKLSFPSSRPQRPASTTSPRSKNLSPSSSVRSTTSTWSNLTTTSTMTTATTISNVSDVSDVSALSETACANAAGSDLPLPSEGDLAYLPWLPIDQPSAATAADVIGDVGYSDFFSNLYPDNGQAVPGEAHPNQSFDYYVPPSVSMALDGVFPNTDLFAQDPSIFAETALQQELPTGQLQDDGKNDSTSNAPKDTRCLVPDSEKLVTRVWEVVSSRVVDASLKLRNFDSADNSLAARLRDATPEHVVDAGVAALQRVLLSEGSANSTFDTLCLLHLVYAFSLVIHETDAVQLNELFAQALAYSAYYASTDRENYLEMVSLLWQPGEPTPVPATGDVVAGELDAVVSNAMAFLDDLEIATILGNTPPQTVAMFNSSDLVIRHSLQQDGCETKAFLSTANTILQALLQDYSRENSLGSAIRAIGQKAACGALSSVRRLEIELIQAGKEHLGSSAKLNGFVQRTRVLCDVAYSKQASAATQRPMFYHGGISLLRLLFAAMEGCPDSPANASPAAVSLQDTRADTDLAFDKGSPVSEAETTAANLTPVDIQDRGLVPAAEKGKVSPPQAPASKGVPSVKRAATVAVGEKCTRCNYRPRGDPEWFQGSMAKHMMTKHSEAEVYYECSFPGCKSRYRNREDNLRQHEKKVHGIGDGKKRPVQDLVGEVTSGGAAKRRKTGI